MLQFPLSCPQSIESWRVGYGHALNSLDHDAIVCYNIGSQKFHCPNNVRLTEGTFFMCYLSRMWCNRTGKSSEWMQTTSTVCAPFQRAVPKKKQSSPRQNQAKHQSLFQTNKLCARSVTRNCRHSMFDAAMTVE